MVIDSWMVNDAVNACENDDTGDCGGWLVMVKGW